MSELNKEIGARISGIRELSDVTVEELAEKIGISTEKLMAYESGTDDIPVSVMHNISNELKISMTELLTGEQAKLSVYSVVRKNKGVGVDRRAAYKYQSLAFNFADRQMDPYLIIVPDLPEEAHFNLNFHEGHEFHYCLEGSIQIKIGKHIVTINEGDSIYFDSMHPHGLKALGNKPAKELVTITV